MCSVKMTDHADKPTEEMVSRFITGTCQLLPKSSPVVSEKMHNLIPPGCSERKRYSILCGSSAEFYIRPLNKCIADLDFLISSVGELAASEDIPVLPSDMSGLPEKIECYKIETYEKYPGFVRLRVLGEMNYNWKNKEYEFKPTALSSSYKLSNSALSTDYFLCTRIHVSMPSRVSGPAIKFSPISCCWLGIDIVESVWCPKWPKEAQGWRNRVRNYGWPTSATITDVLQNGCHVIYAQHHSCKDDEQQWALSFSISEVILLQSWTQIQQIVYNMLRFFTRSELMSADCPMDNEVLCMYHIKTLMLWNCEEKSSEWWNFFSVIVICSKLLKQLSEWLYGKNIPNYFIPEANLFHDSRNHTILDRIKSKLNQFINSDILSNWIVENYIRSSFRTNFQAEITMQHFMCRIRHLHELLKANELFSLEVLLTTRFSYSHKEFRSRLEDAMSCRVDLRHILKLKCHTTNLHSERYLKTTQNVLCFRYYDNLLYMLHVVYGLGSKEVLWDSGFFDEFVKAVSMEPKMIRSFYHNFPKMYMKQGTLFLFLRVQNLMENLTGSNYLSEFQLMSLMSKKCLRKALEYGCPNCKSIAPAALAYLAALHFAASEYQHAIDCCLEVLSEQTSGKEKETLNASCLLFIDDIARIVGLCVLHKKATENKLQYIGKRLYLDLRISPEVFAHYLTALSAERIYLHAELHHDQPRSFFRMDECLTALTKWKCTSTMKSAKHYDHKVRERAHDRKTEPSQESESEVKNAVPNILMEYALENMTSFYSVFHKDFGIECSTVDCYRALYFYKCRRYNEMLHLCERILKSDLHSDLQEFSFANVLLLPPLESFFDADVQSLLGFHTLFHWLSPVKYEPLKCYSTDCNSFPRHFSHTVRANNNELSALLGHHYPIRRHYFLGRHFIARYLKVRYCIDCDIASASALNEFVAQTMNLPFEQIIGVYLLRKIDILKKIITHSLCQTENPFRCYCAFCLLQ